MTKKTKRTIWRRTSDTDEALLVGILDRNRDTSDIQAIIDSANYLYGEDLLKSYDGIPEGLAKTVAELVGCLDDPETFKRAKSNLNWLAVRRPEWDAEEELIREWKLFDKEFKKRKRTKKTKGTSWQRSRLADFALSVAILDLKKDTSDIQAIIDTADYLYGKDFLQSYHGIPEGLAETIAELRAKLDDPLELSMTTEMLNSRKKRRSEEDQPNDEQHVPDDSEYVYEDFLEELEAFKEG